MPGLMSSLFHFSFIPNLDYVDGINDNNKYLVCIKSEEKWRPPFEKSLHASCNCSPYLNSDGGGGHYRTAIGYDDVAGIIYFSDPWGRDQKHQTDKTGVTAWTYEELQSGWNYTAEGESHPYWGMVMMPWNVTIKISGSLKPGSKATVTADVTYPCPMPFNSSHYPAKDAVAMITLPDGMSLDSSGSWKTLGDMNAVSSARATWKVKIDGPVGGKKIAVQAQGKVSGQVPEARWTGLGVSYPAYSYTDAIGGNGSVEL